MSGDILLTVSKFRYSSLVKLSSVLRAILWCCCLSIGLCSHPWILCPRSQAPVCLSQVAFDGAACLKKGGSQIWRFFLILCFICSFCCGCFLCSCWEFVIDLMTEDLGSSQSSEFSSWSELYGFAAGGVAGSIGQIHNGGSSWYVYVSLISYK